MRVRILITIFISLFSFTSLGQESCPKIDDLYCLCKISNTKILLSDEKAREECESRFLTSTFQAVLFQSQDELDKLNNSKLKYNCHDLDNKKVCSSQMASQLAKDFEDGWSFLELDASSPWNKCQWAIDGLKDFDNAEDLEKRLSLNNYSELGLPENFITGSSLEQCFPGENPNSFLSKLPGDLNSRSDLFKKVLVADTYGSLLRLGKEQKNLIQELSYLNSSLNLEAHDGLECSAMSIPRLKEECLAMKSNCNRASSFSQTKEEIFENAVEPMIALSREKRKRGLSSERKKEIEQYEELIKASYPIVMGEEIEKFIQNGKTSDFDDSLKKQFQINKQIILDEINRNNSD